VIEGDAGFGRAMSDGPDWEKCFSSLGKTFNICRMTFKNHTCCGHTFAAIDGALALQSRMQVAAREIERIRVGSYRAAKEVSGYESPQTPAEARFSLKYVVASALTHGSVRLAAFEPARMNDAATRELMARIDVSIDPELDAAFPNQRAARVAFRMRDGREEEFLQPTRIGDPEAPLSDAQLDAKYLELAVPVIGESKAKALLQKLWELDAEKSLAP
jgi:2-methylcitrate dehydratase PrpD